MNDFTKEELQDIVDLINDVHEGTQKHGLKWGFNLRDKIQSMIDNFCEHDFHPVLSDFNIESCHKCMKVK